jgi:putative RNA 2'-phosphotransferase
MFALLIRNVTYWHIGGSGPTVRGGNTHIVAGTTEHTMTAPVSRCDDHGYGSGRTCSTCGATGERVLSGRRRRQLSTFVSGVLRHFPDDAGVDLDEAGWVGWDRLVDSVERQYGWAGERELEAVVATDPKGRFETRETGGEKTVRAAYGHSVDVDLELGVDTAEPSDLPTTLYHGTAPRNVDAIRDEGLNPMNRQAVHLSGSRETARDVGARHTGDDTEPHVFRVDVRALVDAGFSVRKRGPDTYTVAAVPPEFLSAETEVAPPRDGCRSPDV